MVARQLISDEVPMRNSVLVFGSIFSCGLAVMAFGSCESFGGRSQDLTTTSANVSVATNGSRIPTSPTPPSNIETRAGLIPQPKQRDGLCGSGFVDIPAEFKGVFSHYEVSQKDKRDVGIDRVYKLKNEVKFHAFTFPLENKSGSADRDDQLCEDAMPRPEETKFASRKVNELFGKFISALIFNEHEVTSAASALSEVPADQRIPIKVELCLDIECGTEDPTVKNSPFDLSNNADIGTARQYSTGMLLNSVRGELRRVKNADSQERELVDTEINRIIDKAFNIGIFGGHR